MEREEVESIRHSRLTFYLINCKYKFDISRSKRRQRQASLVGVLFSSLGVARSMTNYASVTWTLAVKTNGHAVG